MLLSGAAALLSALHVGAAQVVLEPVKDTTLIEDNVHYSNGAGAFVFIGSIASGSPRRALLQFDLTSIPTGAKISSASLRVVVSKAAAGSGFDQATLQRVAAAWNEGSSAANGGQGSQASPTDTTWAYRVYGNPSQGVPRIEWSTPGGEFDAVTSATTTLGSVGIYTFPSSAQLVADLQGWLQHPAGNFGWIMRGNEVQQKTARRIVGRSSGSTADRPRLTVEYDLPSNADVPLLPLWAAVALAGGLLAAGAARLPASRGKR